MRAKLQSNIFAYKIKESEKHLKGKERLFNLFRQRGYEVYKEVPSQERLEDGQVKNYVFDILLCGRIIDSRNPVYTICEVDGRKGHRTGITDNKTRLRDSIFLEKYGIVTVRFAFEDLHGADKIDDDLIIKEVEYWIKVNYDKVSTQNKLMFS